MTVARKAALTRWTDGRMRNHLVVDGPDGLRLLCHPDSLALPVVSGLMRCRVCTWTIERMLRARELRENDVPAMWWAELRT